MQKTKQESKVLRKKRVRSRISGTRLRPRLSVSRGLKTTSVQLIDDVKGVTLASAYEGELGADERKKTKTERAKGLGALIAHKASAAGITSVVFDRGGNAYHGRVRAVAEAAREGGLAF
jgi:large subunit ribosomal protein L18